MIALHAFNLCARPSSGIAGIFFGCSLPLLNAFRANTITETGRAAEETFEIIARQNSFAY